MEHILTYIIYHICYILVYHQQPGWQSNYSVYANGQLYSLPCVWVSWLPASFSELILPYFKFCTSLQCIVSIVVKVFCFFLTSGARCESKLLMIDGLSSDPFVYYPKATPTYWSLIKPCVRPKWQRKDCGGVWLIRLRMLYQT